MSAVFPARVGGHRPPLEELQIRDAIEADLPAIVDIYNAAIATRVSTAQLEPVTVEDRRDWFRAHSPVQYPIWVAELDDAIAGWLSFCEFLPRCAYRGTVEVSVYVNEKFRRRGVGRKILRQAIAHGPQLGMHSLVGLIFSHNEPSIALFRGAGFERWGFFPGIARVDETPRDLTIFGRHV